VCIGRTHRLHTQVATSPCARRCTLIDELFAHQHNASKTLARARLIAGRRMRRGSRPFHHWNDAAATRAAHHRIVGASSAISSSCTTSTPTLSPRSILLGFFPSGDPTSQLLPRRHFPRGSSCGPGGWLLAGIADTMASHLDGDVGVMMCAGRHGRIMPTYATSALSRGAPARRALAQAFGRRRYGTARLLTRSHPRQSRLLFLFQYVT